MMRDEYIVLTVLIVCVSVIEVVALLRNIDGQLLASVVGLIVGLAGYLLPSPLKK